MKNKKKKYTYIMSSVNGNNGWGKFSFNCEKAKWEFSIYPANKKPVKFASIFYRKAINKFEKMLKLYNLH